MGPLIPLLFSQSVRDSWTPASVTGMVYFLPSPTTCFTDAGTTPAGVGDLVYDLVSTYGTYRFRQATAGNRMTLRQSGSGKYYLESAVGKYMSGTTDVDVAANQPATLAFSFNPVVWADANYHAYLVIGAPGAASQYRSLFQRNDGKINYDTYAEARVADQPDGTVNQSIIVTTATGATVSIYRNGTALSVTGTGAHNAATGQPARFGHDAANYSGAGNYFGFGWRVGTAELTAGEVSSLDSFQRALYA